MNVPQDKPPGERIAAFRAMCRKAGIRVTPQRLEIFRELALAEDHPSAEELRERLDARMPTLSLDTVYRTLATFEQHGIISRVEVLDDHSRFDANRDRHHHLVCVRCRAVTDLQWPAFDQMPTPPTTGWGTVNSKHAELRGICAACLQKPPAGPA
jgi:Fur family peroxide stress response transcriptional regulator